MTQKAMQLRNEIKGNFLAREVVKTLFKYRQTGSVRPVDIIRELPSTVKSKSPNLMYYYLEKLKEAGYVNYQKVSDRLTYYSLTDEGTEFAKELFNTMNGQEFLEDLADILMTYKQISKPKAQVVKALQKLYAAL